MEPLKEQNYPSTESLRNFSIFRFVLVGSSIIPLTFSLLAIAGCGETDSTSGPDLGFPYRVALAIGAPSLIAALGMYRKQRWGAWVAILHDAFIPSAVIGILLASTCFAANRRYSMVDISCLLVPALVLVAPLLIEGVCLIKRMSRRRIACTAFVIIFASVITYQMVSKAQERDQAVKSIQPLIHYADAHWINLPKGANIYIETDSGSSFPDLRKLYPPMTKVKLRAPGLCWNIKAENLGPRIWVFRGQGKLNESKAVLWGYRLPCKILHTEKQALAYLRKAGATDPKIRPSGTSLQNGLNCYFFYSPKVDGTYAVARYKGDIMLYLHKTVNIDGKQ
jgi:hypothetical protein